MPKTYPNQKWVKIHKTELTRDFLSIPNEEWMTANKTLKPYGLQLYLYLAANKDGYGFALSPEAAREAAGITRTTFYAYLRKLEIEGYLVWRQGNVYDFYTSPRPKNERTHPDKHVSEVENIEYVDESFQNENPFGEHDFF